MPLQGGVEADEKRISGMHIQDYSGSAKGTAFSAYRKAGFDVSKISALFEETKKRIKAK